MSPITCQRADGTATTIGDVLSSLPDYTETHQVLIHGVSPSLDTPVAWLAYHCCHPDNFVYISVRGPPPTQLRD